MTGYELYVQHRGTEVGDFCVYQTHDDQSEDIRSLVWFSKRAHPETDLRFEWSIDYGFTWSEQGVLVPGVVFEASQILPTDPADPSLNSISFTKKDGALTFEKTDESTTLGRMGISCDGRIPAREASIGVTMSGKPAFACHASPNLRYTFRSHPRYWIAFGKFDEGEVIDLNHIRRKLEIRFEKNQHEKEILLNDSNTWEDLSK